MKKLTGLALLPLLAGCPSMNDDCSSTKITAAGAYTTLLVAEGEGAYDGKRHRPTIAAWKEIAEECRFPKAEVESVAAALEAADADKSPTKAELEPILREMDKMVTAIKGASLLPQTVGANAGAGGCEFSATKGFAELPPDLVKDGLEGSGSTRETAQKIDALSLSADINLFALAQAEIAHHAKEKSYVTFPNGGNASDWTTLGVTFPAPVRHTFKAVESKSGGLDIVAEGNLDNDGFVDRWLIQLNGKQCPRATVLSMDALNASFEGEPAKGKPYAIVPAGKPQPRVAGFP